MGEGEEGESRGVRGGEGPRVILLPPPPLPPPPHVCVPYLIALTSSTTAQASAFRTAMATAHAGVKRTHHEMNGGAHGREISATSSRTNSPLPAALNGRAEWARAGSVSNGLRATRFPLSSSLVLIGLPGAGKSTLGVIAATAYNRRLVELDKVFAEVVGTPSIAYRKLHGPAEYHRRHAEVLKDTLERYSQDAVIICGISDLENHGAPLLRNYAATHPVIHVTRDVIGIQSYLKALTIERISQLLAASDKLLRSCSNYDFYNLSESTDHGSTTSPESAQVTRQSSERGFLTLKSVERDFLALVQKVFHGFDRWLPQRPVEPFANIELASRDRTLALSLGVSDVLGRSIDLDQAQVGVDCVELTVDIDVRSNRQGYHELAQAFAMLRRSTTLPMLINMTSAKRPQLESKAYLEMAEHCLRLGPELCAIDLALDDIHLAPLIASRGDTKIMGVSDFTQRPAKGWQDDKCFDKYKRARDLKCDMVKITMPARDVDDVFSIHDFRRKIKESADSIPLIAFATGSAGRTSKCFNTILTSVEPPSLDSASEVSETTDGRLTAREVTKALFSSFALEPLQFFVYGGNVEASLSPAMHNAAYEACGLAYTYRTKSSKSLDGFKEISAGITFGGSAIAQPYKTAVIDLLDGLSPHAKAIGAANTVVPIRDFTEGGQLPDEDKVITQRRRQGPVKALYGFNTGMYLLMR